MMPQSVRVLVVCGDSHASRQIQAAFSQAGSHCLSLDDYPQAMRAVEASCPDVLVSDVALGEASGYALLAEALARRPQCRVILISPAFSVIELGKALSGGAYDYFPAPLNAAALVQTALAPAQKPLPDGPHASLESVRALVRAVEAKDAYTLRHSQQVAHYARHLARYLCLRAQEVEIITIAAQLHDVGMIAVRAETLAKAGPLSEEEFEAIRRHPSLGAHILEQIGTFGPQVSLVRHHHERWDGLGYPAGLRGQDIPLGSRVILLADSMDAMLMPRSYKRAYAVGEMCGELSRCAGRQFDPDLAPKALQWCLLHPEKIIHPASVEAVGASPAE